MNTPERLPNDTGMMLNTFRIFMLLLTVISCLVFLMMVLFANQSIYIRNVPFKQYQRQTEDTSYKSSLLNGVEFSTKDGNPTFEKQGNLNRANWDMPFNKTSVPWEYIPPKTRLIFQEDLSKPGSITASQNNDSAEDLKADDDKIKQGTKRTTSHHLSASKSDVPMLTIFTTWVNMEGKYGVHNRTIRNWNSLRPFLKPVVFTNEDSIISQCKRAGWGVLPLNATAPNGKPILKYMYMEVIRLYSTKLVAYANSDILFTKELIHTLKQIENLSPKLYQRSVLIAGSRTNVRSISPKDTSSWESLTNAAQSRGKLFPYLWAIDYFVTTRFFPWKKFPDVAVGVCDYDNFVVWFSRIHNIPTIDASNTILAVHQTTKEGNNEGFSAPLPHYNRDMLKKLFPKFRTDLGMLHCTDLETGKLVGTDEITMIYRTAIIGKCTIK